MVEIIMQKFHRVCHVYDFMILYVIQELILIFFSQYTVISSNVTDKIPNKNPSFAYHVLFSFSILFYPMLLKYSKFLFFPLETVAQ